MSCLGLGLLCRFTRDSVRFSLTSPTSFVFPCCFVCLLGLSPLSFRQVYRRALVWEARYCHQDMSATFRGVLQRQHQRVVLAPRHGSHLLEEFTTATPKSEIRNNVPDCYIRMMRLIAEESQIFQRMVRRAPPCNPCAWRASHVKMMFLPFG